VLDTTHLYQPKASGGVAAFIDIDSRNNQVLPTRGLLLNAGVRTLFGLNEYTNNITRLHGDMRVFMSVFSKPRIVLGVRLGAAHNLGTFDIPQAAYLSGVDNLRGYRRNRFGGRTVFYNNTELRFKVADFSSYLFPGSFGVQVFHDAGRVWMDGEASRRWHTGYGAGVWIAPVRRFVVTASVVRSKEENALPLVTFGFQF
jgi:outer membrane protein assembly factor BamA